MKIELIIEGNSVDVSSDMSLTLNYNSSMFSDIASIKTNGSQTVKLPRTKTNDRIFQLAMSPSVDGAMTHRVLSCRCYVDGVEIIDNGRCHLVGGDGDCYEVAITWGVLHEFQQWLTAKSKLTDLRDNPNDSISWDENSAVSVWTGGVTAIDRSDIGALNWHQSASMFYGSYNAGVGLTADVKTVGNVFPFVTLREIWARVMRDNGISIAIDKSYLEDMEYKAVLLTKNKNKSLQTLTRKVTLSVTSTFDNTTPAAITKILKLNINDAEIFDNDNSSFIHCGYKSVNITIPRIYFRFYGVTSAGYKTFNSALQDSPQDYMLVVKNRATGETWNYLPRYNGVMNSFYYDVNKTFSVDSYEGEDNNGKRLLDVYINIKKWQDLPDYVWENPNYANDMVGMTGGWDTYSLARCLRFDSDTGQLSSLSVSYQENSNDYPLEDFRLVPNLPSVSQIDFVKFICNFYGLAPIQTANGVQLMLLDVISENIDRGDTVDWSDRLVSAVADAPKFIEYKMNYAQRNSVSYKEDSNDPVPNVAYITVDDDTLDDEKKMIEFPFAASKGNVVNQFYYDSEGALQTNDVEYRLMRCAYNTKPGALLYFDETMNASFIVNQRYGVFQDIIRRPKVIEEDMMLSLFDLLRLDYAKPVYLAKYGRYFAIDTIQWSSKDKISKVKLILIR